MLHPATQAPDHTEAVLEWLADYVIDDEPDALDEACAMASHQAVRIDVLLAGLEAFSAQHGDPVRLRRARLALRAALQLPLTPGPVCRAE